MSTVAFLNPASKRLRYITIDGATTGYLARSGNGINWSVQIGKRIIKRGVLAAEVLASVKEDYNNLPDQHIPDIPTAFNHLSNPLMRRNA